MSRLPIRLRVTVVFAAIMAIVLAATGLFLYLRLEAELDESIDQDLRSRAGDIAAVIRVDDVGLGESARSALRRREETLAQVLRVDGRLFDPTAQPRGRPLLDAGEVEDAAQGTLMVERSRVPGLEDEPARLLATPITFEGQPLIIVVGESLEDRDEALSSLSTLLLLGGPAALLLASLAAYFTVGAALRPVESMRRRAAEISAAEPGQRLPVPERQDEIGRLGSTLNEMLDRLEAAFERERVFVADASHELRTPLSILRTELEVALRRGHSAADLRDAVASAAEETDRLSRLADDLLVIARSDADGLPLRLETLDVRDVVERVAGRFEQRAAQTRRELTVATGDGLEMRGDRLRLEQALGNLLDNALRHGGGEVDLAAAARNGAVELHVRDRGAGFPPGFLDKAFDRFSRADEGRARGGTGLGLAIVDVIARAHGGRAVARNRPEGGADVWIEVPLS